MVAPAHLVMAQEWAENEKPKQTRVVGEEEEGRRRGGVAEELEIVAEVAEVVEMVVGEEETQRAIQGKVLQRRQGQAKATEMLQRTQALEVAEVVKWPLIQRRAKATRETVWLPATPNSGQCSPALLRSRGCGLVAGRECFRKWFGWDGRTHA